MSGDNSSKEMMTTARSYIFDTLRKKRTKRKHLSGYEIPEVRDAAPSFDVVMGVNEALSQLKETHRQVIILRFMENFSSAETAQILGWSETKVRTAAQRVLTKLREILGANFEEVRFHHGVRT